MSGNSEPTEGGDWALGEPSEGSSRNYIKRLPQGRFPRTCPVTPLESDLTRGLKDSQTDHSAFAAVRPVRGVGERQLALLRVPACALAARR